MLASLRPQPPNVRRRSDSTTESLTRAAQRGSQASVPNGFVVEWQMPPANQSSSGTGRNER